MTKSPLAMSKIGLTMQRLTQISFPFTTMTEELNPYPWRYRCCGKVMFDEGGPDPRRVCLDCGLMMFSGENDRQYQCEAHTLEQWRQLAHSLGPDYLPSKTQFAYDRK
jgi:hypothetical protein